LQWFCGALLAVLLLASSPALALDAPLSIFQLKHTRWTADEGAPSAVLALAQDRDGFLWVGGADGVYRFDGVTFEKIASPEADAEGWRVSALLASTDGTIWIGYNGGHLAMYRNGVWREVPMPADGAFVMNLLQTRDGAIWSVLGRRRDPVLRYAGKRWEQISTGWGSEPGFLIDARVAHDGSLWVTTLSELWVLHPRSRDFEAITAVTGHAAISEDPLGAIWISDDRGSRPVFPAARQSTQTAAYPTPGSRRNLRALFDRNGDLWGTNPSGVFRVGGAENPGGHVPADATRRVEQYSAAAGLTSNKTYPIIEDREGDIWVGSSRGLDMFRAAPVVAEPSLTSLPMFGLFLFGASNGDVYVGTADAVYRISPGGNPEPLIEHLSETSAICEGSKGTIWIFLKDRFLELRGGVPIAHPLPPIGENEIQNCSVDDHDVLWANAQSLGLFRWESGGWIRQGVKNSTSTADLLTTDRDGHLMLFLRSGDLVRVDQALRPSKTLFTMRAPDNSLYQGVHDFYVGGIFGLARMHKGVQVLWAKRFSWLRDVSAMVETPLGQTWMATRAGIVEVDTAALERAFADPGFQPHPTILSMTDGLPGLIPRANERTGGVALGGDGRVWISTGEGAVWIDPRRLVRNPLPPPVVIRALVATGVRYQGLARLSLPAGTSNVAIEYSGLNLSIPERVGFRYKLDGVDNDWIDAGKRRQAFYTQLGPGTYRFRVIASNDGGPWNRTAATVTFAIAPTFVQSVCFKILVALVLACLIWLGYVLRVRQVTARLQSRFDIRIAERERIARELHDTLLQGCQGLLLQFQSVANRIPAGGELRTVIDGALNRADAVLAEGRARVRELRSIPSTADLTQSLSEAASVIISGATPCFHLTVVGEQRVLNVLVGDEVLRIFEEAVQNVVTHAKAKNIDALLAYGRRSLRLSVRDDGAGMAKSNVSNGDGIGHFGIVGMRERAERISGRLEIASREGEGTEVAVLVPAHIAYKRRLLWPFGRWSAETTRVSE
jgi:signal transduction histidine kinase/ligand-binding sensor domain-containing protein